MNQEESVYELNRIQRYIMQMRPLLKKNALFSDGTADYRQPVEPDAGDEVTVRFRTARDNVDIVWLCTGDKKYKMKKIGVIFGGMSTENEVSIKSAKSVLKNLDKGLYEIYPIYIDKEGKWWKCSYNEKNGQIKNNEEIENVFKYLKEIDVAFPVLHGLYGEDGTIQGLFELLKITYVGCHVLASSVGMDKAYTKIIFERAGLKQAKYKYIKTYKEKYIYINEDFEEEIMNIEEIARKIEKEIKFPMFIKPSNSGSSVGINKANNNEELKKYIKEASKFDEKILVEEGINGKEVECAVLGNKDVIASCIGEIKSADEFYSYDAKYNNQESKTNIPADISKEISDKIKKQAVKAFKAIDGRGLSRVDFFVEKDTNEIYINEINTLPGFTNISMYPELFEKSGINYKELLNRLIELATD